MVRKLVGALSLAALTATGAAAQVPFQQSFTFRTFGTPLPTPDQYGGSFAGGGNIGMTGESANTAFQVWCVDPLQYVHSGQTYTNAWITPLNASLADFTHTLSGLVESGHVTQTGTAAEQEYQMAAYLGLQMDLNTGGYGADAYQEAIWTVMGYTGFGNGTTSATIIANMGSSWNSIVGGEWGVITGGPNVQEFIYHDPAGHLLEVTPEPATMSLLAMGMVGMAGASLRRRKRKQ